MALRIGLLVALTAVLLVPTFLGGSIGRVACPEIRTVGNNRTEAEHAQLVRICQERHLAAGDIIERNQPWPLFATWAAGLTLIVLVTRSRRVVRP